MRALFDDIVSRCEFSADRRYRYWLERTWDDALPRLGFLMLNPSVADEEKNDPTLERCQRRSRRLGYGGFVVVNLFALRSTDPGGLYACDYSVSQASDIFRNDRAILRAARECNKIVAGWGTHGVHQNRDKDVLGILRDVDSELWCLGTTKGGHPRHPLYVAYQQMLVRF